MRSGLIACVLVSALALTGCTDSAEPAPKTQSSESADPTSTDSSPGEQTTTSEEATPEETEPAPPAYPTGIDSFTEENAIKFAEFYIEVINYASQTGDTKLLDEFALDECDWCGTWKGSIEGVYSEGGLLRDYELSAASRPVEIEQTDITFVFTLDLETSTYSQLDSKGQTVETFTTSVFKRDLAASFVSGKWKFLGLGHFKGIK